MENEIIFRIVFFLVLILTFLISGTFRRKARESGDVIERRAEGGVVVFMRLVFALPLFIALLLYIFYPQAIAWSQVMLASWFRYLAAIVAILCIPLIYWVFRSIGKNISETVLTKNNHQLVTHGPYKWVRHPLYASALFLLFSLSIMAANWFLFFYCIAGLLIFRYLVVPAEETKLIDRFGERYVEYKRNTGALAPRLF